MKTASYPRSRRHLSTVAVRWLLGVYGVALALVVLSPTSSTQASWIAATQRFLCQGLGFSWHTVTFPRVEMAANVVMVVPFGLLCALVFPRTRWQSWTAIAFLGSLGVELIQGFLLPARDMAATDVVANTLGALLGAILAHVITTVRAGRQAR